MNNLTHIRVNEIKAQRVNMKKVDKKQGVLKCGSDAEGYREVKVGSHTVRGLYQSPLRDLFSYWNLLLRTETLTQD